VEKLSGASEAVQTARLARTPLILVIDDSRSIRELLTLHLCNAGYEVVSAEDAIAAGKALLAQSPDLIITDVNMPYMTGIEFIAALRADQTIPPIPVVFLSSRQDLGDHARQLQAVAHLPKPVSLERLLEVIALHAGEGRV
jgi:CheY-like chemotaxis protein